MLAGPDVSMWKGAIDWSRVRLAGHELAFAIAKATDGFTWVDPQFHANWHGIGARGLVRGAYHYAEPGFSGPRSAAGIEASARAQAEHHLGVVDSVGGGHRDLPPILDLETAGTLSPSEVYRWVESWVRVVHGHTGRHPIIYTGSFWKDTLAQYTDAFGCHLWLAQWGAQPVLPRAWSRWTLWQFTATGQAQGISGAVDLSYFNGSRAELEALAGHGQHRHHARNGAHGPGRHRGAAPPWPGRVLDVGSRGHHVRVWQEGMRRRGFHRLKANGVYGEQSRQSCRWLELYLRRRPTGRVDEAVWHATWHAP